MDRPRSPQEVFLALMDGIAEDRTEHELAGLYAEQTDVVHPFDPLRAPALRTRDELREHFRPDGSPRLPRRAANITIHETTDPEVIVAEFEYQGTTPDTGEPFALPGIFVLRVRDGEIVSSRDYFDHFAAARIRGQLDGALNSTANSHWARR
jgi:ketosteroid isomerase-like protein